MTQLQWDKLPHQQVGKTLWKDEMPEKEKEILAKLQPDGVWKEKEKDFKAKQLMINLMARQKQAELKSVLDPQTKKRVEILMKRMKKMEPEETARRIKQFDQETCTENFLSELKGVLPTPEQIGKLNVYRNAEPEKLAGLHPSDRLMFDEQWLLLYDGARKVVEAGDALLHAKHFKELLNGGAFGFRVSSINKVDPLSFVFCPVELVDTKSVNNATLLHFLERTIHKHFPSMEEFLDELAKATEAYRVNTRDIRKDRGELRDGLKRIRQELNDYYTDLALRDGFSNQMWTFVGKATSRLEYLVDDVNHADTTFTEVVKYFCEDEKNMTSTEFFVVFKTFVTSYKKCKTENQTTAEERAAVEKRKQAMAESRQLRQNAKDAGPKEADDATRSSPDTRPIIPPLDTATPFDTTAPPDTVDVARDMLAQLKRDGFGISIPSSPTVSSAPRRRTRRKTDLGDFDSQPDFLSPVISLPGTPTSSDIPADSNSYTDLP
ncbi:actin-binding FH2 [Rhizopogon salebrosus TDB-379]|nr:actin-binding FH2 [Rhizopogon salebrosus TDB-379]